MIVKDLIRVIFDDIVLYQDKVGGDFGEFEDIYRGDCKSIPKKCLSAKVCSIGATESGFVDIRIEM